MRITHVGFSGSRDGMNAFQKNQVQHWLREFYLRSPLDAVSWFHHGDCLGADEQAHKIAVECGYNIHLHPPIEDKLRAHLDHDAALIDPPFSYFGRNQRIVLACDVLIATPRKLSGGGTWNTIGHAVKMKKSLIVVFQERIECYGVD